MCGPEGRRKVLISFERIPNEEVRPTLQAAVSRHHRPNLYRFEAHGVLVFDKKARVVGARTTRISPIRTGQSPLSDIPRRPLSPSSRREVESASEGDREKFLRRGAYSPYPTHPVDYTLEVPPDSLSFESRFESGNLAKAIRTHNSVYDLYLSYDTETKGHTQWFYFAVANEAAGTYTFNIVNLLKFDSLYNEGLLPVVRSEKAGNQWQRGGFAVSYYENDRIDAEHRRRKTYTLSFNYTFQWAHDTVYFAHCVPYTFTDLGKYLEIIKVTKGGIARVNPMCQTLAGNVCELITITENIETYRSFDEEMQEWAMSAAARRLNRQKAQRQDKLSELLGRRQSNEHKRKQGIVFTARAHPGETPGSYMLKGVIDFLLSDTRVARLLRRNYVFKIVPMLNPDGVRYGNYRCSTLGVDLNRRWEAPSRVLHPTIFHTKRMIQTFAEWHNVVMFCDFHGHSCKRGVFAYGCSKRSSDLEDRKKSILARMIPILLSQRNPVFSFRDCHFRIDKSKESTARVVLFKELKVVNSYTVEASFYGPKSGTSFVPPRSDCHMLTTDYECLGRDICQVCLYFISKSILARKLRAVTDWVREVDSLGPEKVVADRAVVRSKSLQDSIARKLAPVGESDFRDVTPPVTMRNRAQAERHYFQPAYNPQEESDDFLCELESIHESEEEVLSGTLLEDELWTELLAHEDALDSDGEAGESDSAPSDHGDSPLLTPKPRKRPRKLKQTKPNKAELVEEKPEDAEEKTQPKAPQQSVRVFPAPRAFRPSKTPKSYPSANAIVQLSFLEDSTRAVSSEPCTHEGGLRRPGRLAELLRAPDPREESPLQVTGINDKVKKFGINHYSFLALQRHIEQERQNESGSRVATAQPGRRRAPLPRVPKEREGEEPRRVLRPRSQKAKDATTIEAVIRAKELRKRSDNDAPENSLLSVLPRVQEREAGWDQLLQRLGKGRKLSFKGRSERV